MFEIASLTAIEHHPAPRLNAKEPEIDLVCVDPARTSARTTLERALGTPPSTSAVSRKGTLSKAKFRSILHTFWSLFRKSMESICAFERDATRRETLTTPLLSPGRAPSLKSIAAAATFASGAVKITASC